MNISLARILDRQILIFKFYTYIHIYLQIYNNIQKYTRIYKNIQQINYQQQPEVISTPELGVSNSKPPPSSIFNKG